MWELIQETEPASQRKSRFVKFRFRLLYFVQSSAYHYILDKIKTPYHTLTLGTKVLLSFYDQSNFDAIDFRKFNFQKIFIFQRKKVVEILFICFFYPVV